MDEFNKYIIRYGLELIYDHVIQFNKSDNLPYHNNEHLKRATLFSIKGCEYYNKRVRDIRLIATAALFHDFDHTGSNVDDLVNINNAVNGFLKFNYESETFSERESQTIESLIRSTLYPYVGDKDDLTLSEKIIRDSDILQALFCDDYIYHLYSMSKEFKISLEEMLNGQENFLNSMEFCSKWAQDLNRTKLDEILKKVRISKNTNKFKTNKI